MNKPVKHVLIFILAGISVSYNSFSQSKFKWVDELCEYEGTYDSTKYSEQLLANTYRLLFDDFNLNTNYIAWAPGDIAKLNVDSLDAEYQRTSAELKELAIINNPVFHNYKNELLSELNEVYKHERLAMLAYKNPAVLKESGLADSCTAIYADALTEGGEKLLAAWQKIHQHHLRINGDPEKLQAKFDRQFASPEKYDYAKVEVLNFGWWNCANSLIHRADKYSKNLSENYQRLFLEIKTIYCDEP